MDTIFVVVESEYDYDSAHVVNIKAFKNYIDAETLRFKLQTTQARKNELAHQAKAPYLAWEEANPRPQPKLLNVSLPKWHPKNGSKKNADPAVLAAFVAEEERVRQIVREQAEKNAVLYNEWESRALAATRQIMVELGMTEEEAATIDATGQYLRETDYDYAVEELELA